jgi:BTB/POZ domain-containing protein KCTD9
MFSRLWNNELQPDGSYFVDADPDLFSHILRYLRHGLLPIFFSERKGHDYGMYAALLGEGRYFQIDRLIQWLEKKKYLDVVKVERSAEEVDGIHALYETTPANKQIDYYPVWTKKDVYLCPRGISAHRGHPKACGKACDKARGDAPPDYEEEHVFTTLVVRKTVVFDHDLCVGE